MKKAVSLITVLTVIVLMTFVGCNKRVVPGMPLDCTPSPTGVPTNKISIAVVDYDSIGNTSAAHNVTVAFHYPNNYNRVISADVVSGTADIFVYDMGQYTIELLPNTINGYSNSVFDTITVAGPFSSKTLQRHEPIGFTVTTPTNTNFDKLGGTYTYTFTYHTDTPRRITFTVATNATEGVQYWFSPVSETVNNGDSIIFNVYIPPYYELPQNVYNSSGGILWFVFYPTDAKGKIYSYTYEGLNQTWHFYYNALGCSMILCSGNMCSISSIGFSFYSFGFDTAGITEYGDNKLEFENLEVYSLGAWRGRDYYGGIPAHTMGYYQPIYFPLILQNFSTINNLSIMYQSAGPGADNMRITMKTTWGNFTYRQTFTRY